MVMILPWLFMSLTDEGASHSLRLEKYKEDFQKRNRMRKSGAKLPTKSALHMSCQ
jgi:hypothetical protein